MRPGLTTHKRSTAHELPDLHSFFRSQVHSVTSLANTLALAGAVSWVTIDQAGKPSSDSGFIQHRGYVHGALASST